jgi:hypothetical protein
MPLSWPRERVKKSLHHLRLWRQVLVDHPCRQSFCSCARWRIAGLHRFFVELNRPSPRVGSDGLKYGEAPSAIFHNGTTADSSNVSMNIVGFPVEQSACDADEHGQKISARRELFSGYASALFTQAGAVANPWLRQLCEAKSLAHPRGYFALIDA